jgi:hypothetical protein
VISRAQLADLVLELGDLLLQRLVLLGEGLVLRLLAAELALGRLQLLVRLGQRGLEFLAFATSEDERAQKDGDGELAHGVEAIPSRPIF